MRPDVPPQATNSGEAGLAEWEATLHSQNGEDGILRGIFSQIGFTNRTFVEFGFGYRENNALRLILKEGFRGTYIDGNSKTVRMMQAALAQRRIPQVNAICKMLTRENVNQVVSKAAPEQSLDLLSIDVDGIDYWLWQALDSVDARVVVIEYNASFGPSRSITVPYDPAFDRTTKHPSWAYFGASLTALSKLAKRRNYALIGCGSEGVNAFFVRRDCLHGIPEQTPATAYRPRKVLVEGGRSVEAQWLEIKEMPYIDVA